MSLTLRYALEFAMIIPAAIFAFMPVLDSLKFSCKVTFISSGIILAICILAGAYLCKYYSLDVKSVFIPEIIILFAAYYISVECELGKKLFCFCNAAMLCQFCPMYTTFLMGPVELAREYGPFLIKSGLVSLGLSIVVGLIFYKTLTVKIPMLLNEERIKALWDYMFILPMGIAIFSHWITPISPKVVMTGRVRPISLLLYLIIPAIVFILMHILFWTTSKLSESARLQQENNLLQMESKRYYELKNYMNETRALRHDFRQHVLIISELAANGELDELKNYLSDLTDQVKGGYVNYCGNSAVDALASHYDKLAGAQNTKISWSLELPSTLPINEADYCAMLGNIIENALNAVKNLPEEMRTIKVISSMPSAFILGISTDNPYSEKLKLGKNGLPIANKEGHGLGLISVKNTIERYGGSMNINTDNATFSVDIILYCNS